MCVRPSLIFLGKLFQNLKKNLMFCPLFPEVITSKMWLTVSKTGVPIPKDLLEILCEYFCKTVLLCSPLFWIWFHCMHFSNLNTRFKVCCSYCVSLVEDVTLQVIVAKELAQYCPLWWLFQQQKNKKEKITTWGNNNNMTDDDYARCSLYYFWCNSEMCSLSVKTWTSTCASFVFRLRYALTDFWMVILSVCIDRLCHNI